MTIPTSSVGPVMTYLFNHLTLGIANVGVTGTAQVVWAEPTTYLADNIVALGKVSREVTEAHMIGSGGAGWLREAYTIDVVVSCFRGSNDFQSLAPDLWSLISFVETTVRTDPSLGGAVSRAKPARSDGIGTWSDDHSGILYEGTVTVDCLAEL